MKDKKPLTEEYDQWSSWAQATYRTGSTRPPKSHGGLLAFLLVLVIFLCGISTALGLMNIRLLGKLSSLKTTEPAPVAFSQGSGMEHSDAVEYPLGFAGQAVPAFWQSYHDLPAGIYVVEVTSNSQARSQGLLPGDILIQADGIPLTTSEDLQSVLAGHQAGDLIETVLFRSGQELTLTLILESN